MNPPATARQVVEALWAARSAEELPKVRRRLADDEETFGLRMGELFAIAKRASDLDLREVHRLLDHPAYEPRMAAVCILDFQARRRLTGDPDPTVHKPVGIFLKHASTATRPVSCTSSTTTPPPWHERRRRPGSTAIS